jgi:hypothetical protein
VEPAPGLDMALRPRRRAGPDVTESRAVSVVLAVAMLIAGAVALFAFGPLAVNVLLTVVVSALLLERTSIFRRVDLVWEDTDKALVNSAAAIEGLHDLREWLVTSDEMAQEPEPNPQTDPIGMPAQGPATEEAIEVAARQVRQLMEDGDMEERVVTIGGIERTFRVRVERDAA